jgi:hypothetical protein
VGVLDATTVARAVDFTRLVSRRLTALLCFQLAKARRHQRYDGVIGVLTP